MKIKLLLFRPTMGEGGADKVTLDLLRAFDRTKFKPSLALVRCEGVWLDRVPKDVEVHTLNARNVVTAFWPLSRVLRAEKPDVVFSTSSGTNVAAIIAHRLAGVPGRLVLSERAILHRQTMNLNRWIMLFLKRLLYAKADTITAVSEGVKKDLVQNLGLDSERISVTYNPIVTTDILSLSNKVVSNQWFHERPPIILGVGRLIEDKDFHTLLRAFARVRARRPARLVILGEGGLREDLTALAESLGIEADVDLPGFKRNPFKYMAKCTVFVLSSVQEGLPGALIQAMACGAAVVATDCPSGPAEIITEGQDGYLVPVGDPMAMADRIEYLLDRPEERKRLGKAAQFSAERFSIARVMERYEQSLLGDLKLEC